MKLLKNILLLILLAVFASCKKDDVEPIGFYQVDYYTHPNEDQTFLYYYDDGQLVAGGLDEYMVSVNTVAGTFEDEKLLLLKFKEEIANFPDTLIPYTYFVGLNYQQEINHPLSFGLNLDYPFNNPAHSDYLENEFFLENIESMKLVKLAFEGLADVYNDPDFTIEELPFSYDGEMNDVTFETEDLNALYVLCWSEDQWSDTLSFDITGSDANSQNLIQQGYRYTPIDAEGATFRNGNLVLNYTSESLLTEVSTNDQGWKINELRIKIANPSVGIVDHNDLQLSLLLSIDDGSGSSNSKTYSYLEVFSTTSIEIVSLPGINGYGEINISGSMRLQMTQGILGSDINIKFKRQR